jgi:protocatechuate 3,4-dioxygenase beta subunit
MPRIITSRLIVPRLIVPVVLFLALLPMKTWAQGETTSAIVGQVSDASGAAVPGAMVTIHNTETGLQRAATSDDSGRFSFTQLKPGIYTVRVEAQGFEPQH